MLKVKLVATLALFAYALPTIAAAQHLDPTTKVKGAGSLPNGWNLRFDPAGPAGPGGRELSEIRFETAASGFRIQSGPAAIYYNAKDIGSGEFAVSATFTQQKDLGHEVAGLFIGGSNLQDATQDYIYFVVRAQDGMAMISHRAGDAAPKALKPFFANAGVNRQDANGRATNALTIHVAKDTVHFVANGKLVAAIAKTDLGGGRTDGQVGLRVNHNMDLLIAGYKLSKS
jgi:hypothetical protein